MSKSPEPSPPVNPNPDWQDRDINLGMLIVVIAAVMVVTVGAFIAMNMLMKYYEMRADARDQPGSILTATRQVPEGPLLQADPPGELAAHLAEQRALVSGYAWIDENTGIARIPVDRAMAIVAENGIPEFAPLGVAEAK